jgi:hypothetical protein
MKCLLPFKMRGLKLWGFLTTLGLNISTLGLKGIL